MYVPPDICRSDGHKIYTLLYVRCTRAIFAVPYPRRPRAHRRRAVADIYCFPLIKENRFFSPLSSSLSLSICTHVMWLRGLENKINRMFYQENYFKGPGYIYLKGWVVVSLLNHLKSYNNFSSWVWMRKNHPIFIKASLSPVTLIAADKFFLRTYLICRAAVVLCGCARDKKKKKKPA